MIGCECPVCTSSDPRNRRMRTSSLISCRGKQLIIDTTPELRLQCLANNVKQLDAVLFTHPHADHVFGLDDIRRFNDLQKGPIPCYGSAQTLAVIKQAFEYIFIKTQEGGGKPRIKLIEVSGLFDIAGIPITPIPVMHGVMPVFGYRIGNLAYVTDCSLITEDSKKLLQGLDVLVLGVVRKTPHETHLSLDEGIAVSKELLPRKTYFVHMSHGLEHVATNKCLPTGIELAYDGLTIEIDE